MLIRSLLILMLGLLPALVLADVAHIVGVRASSADSVTRVVFDLSAPADHKVFFLGSPPRLVVDFNNATVNGDLGMQGLPRGVVTAVRSAPRGEGATRVVLDLMEAADPTITRVPPGDGQGHRLVIDLGRSPNGAAESRTEILRSQGKIERPRDLIIAIDAGHGGDDPGALGPSGTREKDVVLAIAKALAEMINRERGMRAVMIRDDDTFISLRERTRIARRHKADLFVSIHADAFRDTRARGSSVYVLSERGASSEAARVLAERENAADGVAGIALDDKDDMLASVLLDLSQTGVIDASTNVAGRVLRELEQIGQLHKGQVERAGFAVLKSYDIPSLLVETAFISNPQEERRLRDAAHQRRFADAVLQGVRDYFRTHAPPGTLLAVREPTHVITRGETLAQIAQQYQVSVDQLRMANAISGDAVQAGKILRIPVDGDS